ncbi:MAG: RNA degradosome polyphosphate kinase, partial [Chloroflexota bacterium]|nr:RNA degradosome polyphosphate kinase [Chloroflexota bacterium]
QAGVRINLVIRGICCLRPGVEGVSENISVVSLVGRFLEHARVLIFGEGKNQKVYLGSCDLMERNLDGRVETLFPLREQQHRERVCRMLELQIADNVNAWQLKPDGCYAARRPEPGDQPLDSQLTLIRDGT